MAFRGAKKTLGGYCFYGKRQYWLRSASSAELPRMQMCKDRGHYKKWMAAGFFLGFMLAVIISSPLSTTLLRGSTYKKLSTGPQRIHPLSSVRSQHQSTSSKHSTCKRIEKISNTQKCPLLTMLEKRSLSVHRLKKCNVVFYNRVPKCASRTILGIFKQLACENGYKYISELGPQEISTANMTSLAHGMMETQQPLLFARHLNYINFSSLDLGEPVYLNVIRDPIQRAISRYYYNGYGSNNKRSTKPKANYNTSMDECIRSGKGGCFGMTPTPAYFCGHSPECRKGGPVALKRAKRTIQEHYLLVGITEDIPAFMETLSHLMPHFFSNATAVYNSIAGGLWLQTKTARKQDVSNETMTILKEHLAIEIEFYKFVRQRFYYIHNRVSRFKEGTQLWHQSSINNDVIDL